MKKQDSDHTMDDLSDGDFGNLCRQLDDNDVDIMSITLGEPGLTPLKAIQLGGCLERNTKVESLLIDFAFVKIFCGSIFSFVKFIENSKSLRNVVLVNADVADLKVCSALLVLLPGIAKNSCITNFEMRAGHTVYHNILMALWYTIIHALFGGTATVSMLQSSVAFSIGQCQSLENMVLAYLPESFSCQVLPELAQFHALYSLTFIPSDYYSSDTLDAMASLVRSSMTLETLQLEDFQFSSSNFMSLAEGLVDTMSVKDLSFANCAFKSTSTQMVEDVATTMKKVTIGKDVKFSRAVSKVLTGMVAQAEDSALKELDLTECPLKGKHLTGFFNGIEDNGGPILEVLSLPSIVSPDDVKAIEAAVVRMPSLKEIRIAHLGVDPEEQIAFVEALKEKSGILKCCFNGDEIAINRPTLQKNDFSFKTERQHSLRRSKKLRKALSSDELKQLDNKDESLHRQNSSKSCQSSSSESKSLAAEPEYHSHREKMMATVQRHRLSNNSLDALDFDE